MRGWRLAHIQIGTLFAVSVSGLVTFAAAQPAETTNSFLVGRGQYRFYSCVQLDGLVKANETRQHELLALIAKAKQGPGGGLVSALSYEPDLAVARGELAELRREQLEKKCQATAPARPTTPPRRR